MEAEYLDRKGQRRLQKGDQHLAPSEKTASQGTNMDFRLAPTADCVREHGRLGLFALGLFVGALAPACRRCKPCHFTWSY